MPRRRIPLPDIAKELLAMVRCGKLFSLQQWIADGKPLRFDELNDWESILCAAIHSGFHSMVEVALRGAAWSAEELTAALDSALHDRRIDLAKLLLNSGAAIGTIDFADICSTMNAALMELFLRAGGDPGRGNAFARALTDYKAKPLLGFYRGMRAEFPALDPQAALALQKAVSDRNLRWVSLLAWAGADPLLAVPHDLHDEWGSEDEMTTAASSACWIDDEQFLRALKLKPTREQALDLCHDVAYRPSIAKLEMFVRSCGDLNGGERRSCKAPEDMVRQHKWRHEWHRPNPDEDVQRLRCMEFLLDRGARWNPADDEVRYVRQALGTQEAKYVVQVVRLLLYTPGAAEMTRIWELCRTPKLRGLIRAADDKLWDELLALRPDQ